jgi:hypothetical protein
VPASNRSATGTTTSPSQSGMAMTFNAEPRSIGANVSDPKSGAASGGLHLTIVMVVTVVTGGW